MFTRQTYVHNASTSDMNDEVIASEKSRTRHLLSERSRNELRLASPYTVYIKDENNGSYTWLSYSLGRPRNVVWGVIRPQNGDLKVEYGCRWESYSILSRMLENRESRGFILVSTLASDKVTHFMAYPFIEAYQRNTDLQMGKYFWEADEISNMFIDEFMRRGIYDEITGKVSVQDLEAAGHSIALRLQDKPNRVQMKKTPIPEKVVNSVHDFVGHNPTLSSNSLPQECPSYDDCLVDPTDPSCGMYYGIDIL